jgi:hypothetical protein
MSKAMFARYMTLVDAHWSEPNCWQLVSKGLVDAAEEGEESAMISNRRLHSVAFDVVRWVTRQKLGLFRHIYI